MGRELSKRAETLLQLIDNYGSITLSQAAVACGSEEAARTDLSHLIRIKCVHEREGLYVPVRDPKPDVLMACSLWVAIDKVKAEDGSIDRDALATSFTNLPVHICLIMKDNFYNIVTISNSNIASTMAYLKDKFSKNYSDPGKAKGQEYIFVVRDTDTIKQIAEYMPNMPNRIALLEGDVFKTPRIRYLSPKKS